MGKSVNFDQKTVTGLYPSNAGKHDRFFDILKSIQFEMNYLHGARSVVAGDDHANTLAVCWKYKYIIHTDHIALCILFVLLHRLCLRIFSFEFLLFPCILIELSVLSNEKTDCSANISIFIHTVPNATVHTRVTYIRQII